MKEKVSLIGVVKQIRKTSENSLLKNEQNYSISQSKHFCEPKINFEKLVSFNTFQKKKRERNISLTNYERKQFHRISYSMTWL